MFNSMESTQKKFMWLVYIQFIPSTLLNEANKPFILYISVAFVRCVYEVKDSFFPQLFHIFISWQTFVDVSQHDRKAFFVASSTLCLI